MSTIILTTMIMIISFLWISLAILLFKAVTLGIRSKRWLTTRGRIMLSEIEVIATTAGRRYREVLQYEYIITGVTYQSNTISFPDHLVRFFMNGVRSKKNAESIINKYPVGSEVVIYYEPSRPERSTLETGLKNINFILVGVITTILGAGLLMVLLSMYISGFK